MRQVELTNLYVEADPAGIYDIKAERKVYQAHNAFAVSFAVPPIGAWHPQICDEAFRLQSLENDWDGYGSPPVEPLVAHHACNVLTGIERMLSQNPNLQALSTSLKAPYLVPISGGALQAEWHFGDTFIEIFFDRDLSISAEFYSEGNAVAFIQESENLEFRGSQIHAPKLIGWFQRAHQISNAQSKAA